MLVAEDGIAADHEFYSSCPLGNEPGLHADHRGQLKTTSGAQAYSLDSFVRMRGITKIDLIKLDVDGHEPNVLAGAWLTLQSCHPTIFMEWSPNLFTEHPDAMRLALSRLLRMRYSLFDGSSGRRLRCSEIFGRRRCRSEIKHPRRN